MQFRRRMKETAISKAVPIAANCADASSRLAEKLAIQREWMKQRGIDILLKDSERPPLAKKKAPLPGTILYFSRNS